MSREYNCHVKMINISNQGRNLVSEEEGPQ